MPPRGPEAAIAKFLRDALAGNEVGAPKLVADDAGRVGAAPFTHRLLSWISRAPARKAITHEHPTRALNWSGLPTAYSAAVLLAHLSYTRAISECLVFSRHAGRDAVWRTIRVVCIPGPWFRSDEGSGRLGRPRAANLSCKGPRQLQ
jgi:hypothetical protein